jgi:hypothetical protein
MYYIQHQFRSIIHKDRGSIINPRIDEMIATGFEFDP